LQNEDTIVAVITGGGAGAVSVLRISGNDAIQISDSVFSGKRSLAESATHTVHYGRLTNRDREIIDDVLASVFKAPHSYTGENSVEISCHGNPLIVQKAISALLASGARLAEPGEFTRRAFLNGRIDLAQAEAVADVIASRSEASLRGARNQLDGLLSAKIDSLREGLINISSLIELELDFVEDDLQFIDYADASSRVRKIVKEIESLLSTFSFGRVLREGVNVVIVGRPNAGKSSLLNYMLKESRAIVSATPGTTRDIIREEITIDGVLFRLYDTAGIRTAENEIEQEGVARSRDAVKNADLVLLLYDALAGEAQGLRQEIEDIVPAERIISAVNKIDKVKECGIKADVYMSALTGQGLDELFSLLKKRSALGAEYTEKSVVVSNARHYDSLCRAAEYLGQSLESLSMKMSGEFISVDLRNAINALSEIIGKVTSEDILNNIFSKFCIGK
jgi:tRNA modification GTPase